MILPSILMVSSRTWKYETNLVCLSFTESPATTVRQRQVQAKEDFNESDNDNNNNEEESTPKSKPPSRKPTENEDDTFLERFQQQQRKREKLETKAKISHRVFCPFYPEVTDRRPPFRHRLAIDRLLGQTRMLVAVRGRSQALLVDQRTRLSLHAEG